jgi:hypothetical protein
VNELDPIAPEIASLLEAERRYDPSPDGRKERVLVRLGGSVAAIGLVAGAAHGLHAAVGLTVMARFLAFARTKVAIFLGALAAGGAVGGTVGYRIGERGAEGHASRTPSVNAPHPSPSSAIVLPPASPSELPPSPSSAPVPSTSAPASKSDAGSAARLAGSVTPKEDLAGELALVQMARSAVARREFEAALDATNRHLRQFPQGQLAEERESVAIQALIGAGRDTEARARAARFRAKYPRSSFLGAIEAAIRSIP